jgi:riboflavin synthase
VSGETLSKTSLGDWKPRAPVNLERAAKLGDEMGGHVVSGHVDGLGGSWRSSRWADRTGSTSRRRRPLHRYIAAKGSITVDGVSLTVNGRRRPNLRREHHPPHLGCDHAGRLQRWAMR